MSNKEREKNGKIEGKDKLSEWAIAIIYDQFLEAKDVAEHKLGVEYDLQFMVVISKEERYFFVYTDKEIVDNAPTDPNIKLSIALETIDRLCNSIFSHQQGLIDDVALYKETEKTAQNFILRSDTEIG